jgi:hypothetical protein
VIDIASYRPRFTLLGLTISEETDSDGLEGYRVRGINRSHHIDEFIAAMDLEKFYERLRRRNT